MVFNVYLLIVLTAPLLFRHLQLPKLVNPVITKMILKTDILGILRQKRTVRLLNGIKLLCVVFLSKLRVGVSRFHGGHSHDFIFNIVAFAVPRMANALVFRCLLKFS